MKKKSRKLKTVYENKVLHIQVGSKTAFYRTQLLVSHWAHQLCLLVENKLD